MESCHVETAEEKRVCGGGQHCREEAREVILESEAAAPATHLYKGTRCTL